MYSKRQVEVAEEHGVILKSIPVLDLAPFDKIFMDTQEVEDIGRAIKYFTPHAVFQCNCHRHVPTYKRRTKIMCSLVDDKGNTYHDNAYQVYADQIEHHAYCSQLARYRYENDYDKDSGTKYAPKKNHLIFTGQTLDLHTVTYTFERDEEVLLVEDIGKTTPAPMTVEDGQHLVDIAEMDEEIENTSRYFDYSFNSWHRSCERIHDHHDDEYHTRTLEQHNRAKVEHIASQLKTFNDILNKIDRIGADNFNSTDANSEQSRQMYMLRDNMRYLVRDCHYKIYDNIGESRSLYGSSDTTYEEFLNTISLIEEIEKRFISFKESDKEMTTEDFFYIMYGDKLKRKYEIVV